MYFDLYEGEDEIAKKNQFIARLVLSNISDAKAGEINISVKLKIDQLGRLTFEAHEEFNADNTSKSIEVNLIKGLNEKELLHCEQNAELIDKHKQE